MQPEVKLKAYIVGIGDAVEMRIYSVHLDYEGALEAWNAERLKLIENWKELGRSYEFSHYEDFAAEMERITTPAEMAKVSGARGKPCLLTMDVAPMKSGTPVVLFGGSLPMGAITQIHERGQSSGLV